MGLNRVRRSVEELVYGRLLSSASPLFASVKNLPVCGSVHSSLSTPA
ncbi:hypothetical protein [Streptomyces sp. SAS_276]